MKTVPRNLRTRGGEPTELLRLEPPELRAAILAIVEQVFDPKVVSTLADGVARWTPDALLRFASWVEVQVPDDSGILAPLGSRLESGPGLIRFVTEFETWETETGCRSLLPDRSEVGAGEVVVPGASNLHMRLHVLGALHVHELYERELAALFGATGPEHLALIRTLLGFVQVVEPGDTDFERGRVVSREAFLDHNEDVLSEGLMGAHARETLVPLSSRAPGHRLFPG